jgi:hypothetical protein
VDREVPQAVPWRITAVRGLIALVAVAGLVLLGSSIAEIETFRNQVPEIASNVFLGYVLAGITAGLACLLALVIVWRISARSDARFLALFLSLLAFFWGALFRFLQVKYAVVNGKQELTLGITVDGIWPAALLSAAVMAAAAFLSFAAEFPTDASRPRWLTNSRIWRTALVIAAIDFVPTGLELIGVMGEWVAHLPKAVVVSLIAYLLATHLVLPIAAIVLGVFLLAWNYRKAGKAERRSGAVVVAGFTAALTILLIATLVAFFELAPEDDPTAFTFVLVVLPSLAPLVIVLALALAVFYTGTFDPSLVIRKTTVYAAIGVVATGVFALVENLISATLARWLHLPNSVSTIAASIAVAFAVVPLRDRLVRFVERPSPSAAATPAGHPPVQDA